jgi:histidine triad (HIT) family protein
VDGCIFCEIAAGTRPADVVFESEDLVCFLDIRPLFPGHVLVCPRAHVETIEDLADDGIAPLFATVRATARAVRTALEAQGTFVAQNNVVSQSVPHLHIHVVPRTKGDGLRGFFWPRSGYDDDAHKEQVRAAIAAVYRDA